MSFSSRRRNYLLTPHRRDGLIEWMKTMLMHSFVLDALDTTGADTFSHFEMLIDEHRQIEMGTGGTVLMTANGSASISSGSSVDNRGSIRLLNKRSNAAVTSVLVQRQSRLKTLVPTVGTFHTRLPLRRAFLAYNEKFKITQRRYVCISFNELRHILNLAQIMALRSGSSNPGDAEDADDSDNSTDDEKAVARYSSMSPFYLQSDSSLLYGDSERGLQPPPPPPLQLDSLAEEHTVVNDPSIESTFRGPKMITFDGDQTLYSDGANFESNPKLATYLYLLLRHGVTVAVVTAAGYEYQREKYELRLSGLLAFFKELKLPAEDCARFYLFGGECNYLLTLGSDYRLHAVKEYGPGGWILATKYIPDAPGNWDEQDINEILDISEETLKTCVQQQKLRARVVRKRRAVGMFPKPDFMIPREALDEAVLTVQAELLGAQIGLPFCAFNGGRDCWVDVGNKRVGVEILQSYLGIPVEETLHIGDQFLNTGNDYAARDICPCVWITSPDETTYILKSILRLAGVSLRPDVIPNDPEKEPTSPHNESTADKDLSEEKKHKNIDFAEIERRTNMVQLMDVYTGEIKTVPSVMPRPESGSALAHGSTDK